MLVHGVLGFLLLAGASLSPGDTLLDVNDLKAVFPAVTQEPLTQRTYYFAGDFANNSIPFWTARFKNVDWLARALFYSDNQNDPKRFFWSYYKPLVTSLFKENHDNPPAD